ncbi:MAG TPA: hypothetical protein VLL05_07870 [Terriglobales bacterium]|nr:hypothetical protein [Terriglobales bacterium]
MKARQLTLLLPLVHFLIAGALIGSEESKHWRLHIQDVERFGLMERWENEHTENSTLGKTSKQQEADFQERMASEYRPSSETKSINFVELPAAAAIGWFGHPLTGKFGGFLQPFLHKLTFGMSAAPRILFLDGLLVLAICCQWCLVGYWLDKRKRQNEPIEFQRNLVLTITTGGFVAVLLCRAGGWWESIAALAALGAALAWAILILSFALAVGTYARTLFSRNTTTPERS